MKGADIRHEGGVLVVNFAKPGRLVADNTARKLLDLASLVEDGKVEELVTVYVVNNELRFVWGSTKWDAVALLALAQTAAIEGCQK